ncbi:MAG: hypothetical protein L3J39_01450 [Verrucomicrobiales bacterium]|nr:hypothetical protein [Verrucomicrobiales bacterium]
MYQIFDILVDCYLPLFELPKIKQGSVSLKINLSPNAQYKFADLVWQNHWYSEEKQIAISSTRKGDGSYLIRYVNLADFHVSAALDSIVVHPAAGTNQETIRHLLLDQLIPRILGQRGKLILHASAVTFQNDSSIAFLGSSGWGKSTIASSFAQHGFDLISDDCLQLDTINEKIIGIPAYTGTRLFPDSIEALYPQPPDFSPVCHYSEKKRLHTPPYSHCSQRAITAIFLLNDPADQNHSTVITIEPVKGAASLMTLIKRCFLLDMKDIKIAAKLFKKAAQAQANGLDIYSLSYPRDYDKLADLRTEILSTINQQKQIGVTPFAGSTST